MKQKIGIAFGGKSVEHDISILTGIQVLNALDKEKYEFFIFYFAKNNLVYTNSCLGELNFYKKLDLDDRDEIIFSQKDNQPGFFYKLKPKKFFNLDCIICCFHGAIAEDGTISSLFELINLPYTSSELKQSKIVQDKSLTKELVKSLNYKVIPYVKISLSEEYDIKINNFISEVGYPLIVKPNTLGSSIGINVIKTAEELTSKIMDSFAYDSVLIIEPKIENFKELNCAALRSNEVITSAIEEIINENNILTFKDKYLRNKKQNTSRLIPSPIEKTLEDKIKLETKKIYEFLELDGVVRMDYIYDLNAEVLYLNEVNNIPGSMGFYLFEKEGINFTLLLDKIIKNALIRHNKKSKQISYFESSVLAKNKLIIK